LFSFCLALVGSLTIGTTFFLSPVAGILTDKIGIQRTTFIGGALATLGMFSSSFLTDHVEGLYVSYGVVYGIGASLVYTPSLVILGHYFDKYMGIVNGIVTAGSSLFTILMPYVIYGLITHLGLSNCLRCLGLMMFLLMGSSVLFKPLAVASPATLNKSKPSSWRSVINMDIWKQRRYLIWSLVIPVALFGYFVPYVHMVKFVEVSFPEDDGKLLVLMIGLTSGLGRIIFGKIADYPSVNRIVLQQISFVMIGMLTMLMTVTNSFVMLEVIALGMGLFDGCFISLLGPIAFDLCGHQGAGQAIGFLLGLCSLPLTVGPPVAGLIYDHTGSYTLPFLLAGIPPIVGGICLSVVHCVPQVAPPRASPPLFNGKSIIDTVSPSSPLILPESEPPKYLLL
ncbi:hypothetical protein AAG570_008835, partial [Ranatra chinensis]